MSHHFRHSKQSHQQPGRGWLAGRLMIPISVGIGCLLVFPSIVPGQTGSSSVRWDKLLEQAQVRLAEQRQEHRDGMPLVRNGQPIATLIASTNVVDAANLLNDWIELMSGVRLPVAKEKTAGPSVWLVSPPPPGSAAAITNSSPTGEAFRIRCDGQNVTIASESPAAAYRAVGRFLEVNFGCRWLADPDWGRVYPTRSTLTVPVGDFTERPRLLYRRIWGANSAFRQPRWVGWNGDGGLRLPMGHAWKFLNKDDFAEHPDWFRMDENGQRVAGVWPNLGNPEVRRQFVEHAVTESENGTKHISLSPPDSYQFDYSPETATFDNPNVIVSSSGRVSMTDRFLTIVNEAAKAVYQRGQESIIGFYAYSDYTMPPTRPELQKLSSNLCIWIAPIRYSRYHPIGHPNSTSRRELKTIIDGWANCASMLGYRTYNYNLGEVLTPFSKLGIWARDIPYLGQRGCIGMSLESFNCWELSAPHLYLSLRLSYDPTLDPWDIVADYCVSAYGPAAAPMLAYWLAVDRAWVTVRTEAGSIHALPQIYTPELLRELDVHLTAAEKAAASLPDCQARVILARRGLQRAVYWRRWFDAFNQGDLATASAIYDDWMRAVVESVQARNANAYERDYLKRYVGQLLEAARAAVSPKGQPERRVIMVLPDRWTFATGDYAGMNATVKTPVWAAELDDQTWPTVQTYGATLSAQGYPEYFGDLWYRAWIEVPPTAGPLFLHVGKADRKVTVYVNGRQVNENELEAFRGATVEVTDFLRPGEKNFIALKIRHIPLPELFLGGLVGPVYLIGPK